MIDCTPNLEKREIEKPIKAKTTPRKMMRSVFIWTDHSNWLLLQGEALLIGVTNLVTLVIKLGSNTLAVDTRMI